MSLIRTFDCRSLLRSHVRSLASRLFPILHSSPRLFSAAVAAFGLLTPIASEARDIYVAATGSDANTGTEASPYREVRKALAVIAPGDTVLISDGNYKGFNAVSLGSATTTTTLRATGDNVIITSTTDRGVNDPSNIVVWLCTKVVFEGLRTFAAPLAGMRIIDSHHITVRNGVFGNNGKWGIVTSHCDDLLIENNDCYGSVIEHGIYVANSGDRPIVRGNLIHGNTNSGLRANGDISQGGDGIISGAIFEDNIIYDNGTSGGGAMNFDGLQDGIIRNNLIYNNRATGIALFKGGGAAGPSGMQVLNNTIIVMAGGRYCLRITDVVGPLTVRNNILYNLNTAKGPFSWNTPSDAAFTGSDYNLFGGGRYVSTDGENSRITMDNWIASGHEPHSVPNATLAQLFVSPTTHDYRLAAVSPAIDRATSLANVASDLLGVSRPQGTAPDIGAYEYSVFEAWKSTNSIPFSTLETSDLDGDGVPLLIEYGLGLNPNLSDAIALPAAAIVNDRLQLQYTPLRADIDYFIETSADLKTWTTTGVLLSPNGPQITASIPTSGTPKFLRLRFTRP